MLVVELPFVTVVTIGLILVVDEELVSVVVCVVKLVVVVVLVVATSVLFEGKRVLDVGQALMA